MIASEFPTFQMKLEAKHGKINLGNKGLTKLWNINPDNLGLCWSNYII